MLKSFSIFCLVAGGDCGRVCISANTGQSREGKPGEGSGSSKGAASAATRDVSGALATLVSLVLHDYGVACYVYIRNRPRFAHRPYWRESQKTYTCHKRPTHVTKDLHMSWSFDGRFPLCFRTAFAGRLTNGSLHAVQTSSSVA
eukprot:9303301-Pyramimonas_sp.AAC.1